MNKDDKQTSILLNIAQQYITDIHVKVRKELNKQLEICEHDGIGTGQRYGLFEKIILDTIHADIKTVYDVMKTTCQEHNIRLSKKAYKKVKTRLIEGYQSTIGQFFSILRSDKYSGSISMPKEILDANEKNNKLMIGHKIEQIMEIDRGILELKRMSLGDTLNFWMTILGALGFLLALAAFIMELCSTTS